MSRAKRMAELALLTLVQWLSPGFPVGAFSYSHGLETAHEAGDVTGAEGLEDWLAAVLAQGAGRNDAIFLTTAYRAQSADETDEINALACAMAPSKERLLETLAQGQAFGETVRAVWHLDLPARCYPVAVGQAAGAMDLPLGDTTRLFLQSFAANIVSAGVRLIPIGQTQGQRIVARLAPLCTQIAQEALEAGLDDLGGAAVLADIRSMQHETQYTRLYRS